MDQMSEFRRSCRHLTVAAVALFSIAATGVSASAQASAPAQTPVDSTRVTEEVFVTATVTPVAASAVGRTTLAITRSDVDQLGLRSIIEVLRLAPGIDVRA